MNDSAKAIYEFSVPLLNGKMVQLSDFCGQVLLIVNTASKCGYTPQYTGLEALYRTYKEQGFVVLGFPCNQFGGQEPAPEAEIASFCERNYGVSFPLFAKISVNGPETHPLYRDLKHAKPGIFGSEKIKWNFTKFLVDRQGKVVARFAPATKPMALRTAIEKLLR